MSKNNNLPLFSLISAALTAPLFISSAQAAGFWDDSHLTGGSIILSAIAISAI